MCSPWNSLASLSLITFHGTNMSQNWHQRIVTAWVFSVEIRYQAYYGIKGFHKQLQGVLLPTLPRCFCFTPCSLRGSSKQGLPHHWNLKTGGVDIISHLPIHISDMHGLILFKLGTNTVRDGMHVSLALICDLIKDG